MCWANRESVTKPAIWAWTLHGIATLWNASEQLPTSTFTDVAFAPEMGTLKFGVPFAVAQDRAKPNTSICIGEEPYYAMPRHKFVSCHRHLQTCKSQFSFSVEPRLLCMRYNVMCLSEGSLFRGPLRTASLFMKGSAITRQDIKQHHMRGQMRDGEFLLQKSNTTCSTTKNVEMLKEVSPEWRPRDHSHKTSALGEGGSWVTKKKM